MIFLFLTVSYLGVDLDLV